MPPANPAAIAAAKLVASTPACAQGEYKYRYEAALEIIDRVCFPARADAAITPEEELGAWRDAWREFRRSTAPDAITFMDSRYLFKAGYLAAYRAERVPAVEGRMSDDDFDYLARYRSRAALEEEARRARASEQSKAARIEALERMVANPARFEELVATCEKLERENAALREENRGLGAFQPAKPTPPEEVERLKSLSDQICVCGKTMTFGAFENFGVCDECINRAYANYDKGGSNG